MYKAYLFNEDGRYQAPVYLDDDTSVITFVFRYKHIVPRIMITQRDESVFEVENNNIVFPELDSSTVQQLEGQVLPLLKDTEIVSLMTIYQDRVNDFKESKGKDRDVYRSLIQIENDMFALAARDNLNLASFGWVNSGAIEAELDVAYSD